MNSGLKARLFITPLLMFFELVLTLHAFKTSELFRSFWKLFCTVFSHVIAMYLIKTPEPFGALHPTTQESSLRAPVNFQYAFCMTQSL